jgi:serine/threonine-protein kinase
VTLDPRLSTAFADRYRLERELGQGGMATVYLAEDLKHHRRVAVKVLRPELAMALGADRFLREIETTANLRHPNIVPLFDSGAVTVTSHESRVGADSTQARDSRLLTLVFYVMPFIEGESLRDRLNREKQLPIADALQIAHEVADALGYAHGRGVIHRDIKPENILLERGHAVVADFGIARAASAAGGDRLTQTGMAIGTPVYMSPEQSVGESDLDGRSDLYALGSVLYEMLGGEPPYNGPTAQAIIAKRFREPVPRISTLRDSVPPAVEAALNRLLAKAPADRFATAEEFSAALRAPGGSGAARPTDIEEFWVAVLPFKSRGVNADLTALAEGLTEEIMTGLSRFSYLRVIARSSTQQFTGEATDVRSVGARLGARYVMEGSLRQAGSALRVSVQLVDTTSGAQLWAETYDRAFQADEIFALQDDLVPRIVSSVADAHGALPHTLSESLRSRGPEQLTPYEAVLRSFGYGYRMTPEEHATVRECLELAVEQAPGYADAWGMLSLVYTEEFSNGFNTRPEPLERALQAARRAADAAPSSALAYNALARALFFRKEFQAFRVAADRAIELNPFNGPTLSGLGGMMAYAGDWERGCAQVERAARLNPRHPSGYWFPLFYNAYRQGDYRAALSVGLKINLPEFFATHEAMAAAYGQLGEREAAAKSLRELLRLQPEFAINARSELGKWFDRDFVEHQIDGLRKAGLEVEAAPGTTTPIPVQIPAQSVAVLPFANMSAEPDDEFFADGITEDVIAQLSKIRSLKVISRSSVMPFKGRGQSLREIGAKLHVATLLEGSVRRAGSRVRIVAQLIDAQTDRHLWTETYDRELTDIFAIQTDVALQIASALEAELSPEEARRIGKAPTEDIQAYQLYLMGRHCLARWTQEGIDQGIKHLEQAIARDPNYALAYSTIAYAYTDVGVGVAGALPPEEAFRRAKAAVRRALELDGGLAEAHAVSAHLRFVCDYDWAGAEAELKLSIQLNPNSGDTYDIYGLMLSALERYDEAIEMQRKAHELDPLLHRMDIGTTLLRAGRLEEAMRIITRVLEVDPHLALARATLAWCYLLTGKPEQGIAALQQAISLSPEATLYQAQLGEAYAMAGRTEEARGVLRQLEELSTRRYVSPYHMAYVHTGLGEHDRALDWLERAYEERAGGIFGMKGSFLFVPLRGQPRFQALLRKMNLA